MYLTASKLRENIYQVLDEVLRTGKPVEILRNGKRLQITAAEPEKGGRLARLKKRSNVLNCDPDEIVHMDWSSEWKPDLP